MELHRFVNTEKLKTKSNNEMDRDKQKSHHRTFYQEKTRETPKQMRETPKNETNGRQTSFAGGGGVTGIKECCTFKISTLFSTEFYKRTTHTHKENLKETERKYTLTPLCFVRFKRNRRWKAVINGERVGLRRRKVGLFVFEEI